MGSKHHGKALLILFSAVVLLFFFTAHIMAETQETAKKEEQKGTKQQSPALSGAKTARDPDGAIRQPTDKENREFSGKIQQTLRKYPRHQMKTGKDGSSLVIAPYNFRWSVATVGPDGKLHYSCAENTKHIDAAVESAKNQTASKAEKE